MTQLREANTKGLAVLICSLLAIFQPAAEAAAGRPTGQPAPGASAIVAVAEVVGTVERNGSPLLNGGVVGSGDLVSTSTNSALLLAAAGGEELWLGPNTVARVSKASSDVSVALQQGTMKFRTLGHMTVTFADHEGVALKGRSGSPASARLSFANDQRVSVNVASGALELVQGGQSQVLEASTREYYPAARPSPSAARPATSNSLPQANGQNGGSLHGTIVGKTLVAVPGASVTLSNPQGNSYVTVSDQLGHFYFNNVPPGSYTLHVTHAGFPDYNMRDVAVTSGTDTAAYVQLQTTGNAGGGPSHGLVIGLVAAGAVGGGVGIWAATKSKGSVSPTTTQ